MNILGSPFLSAFLSGIIVMVYTMLMTYNPNLPPSLLISIVVSFSIYTIMSNNTVYQDTNNTNTNGNQLDVPTQDQLNVAS